MHSKQVLKKRIELESDNELLEFVKLKDRQLIEKAMAYTNQESDRSLHITNSYLQNSR